MTSIRIVAAGLLGLMFVALPAAIVIGGIQQLLIPIEWSRSIEWRPSAGDIVGGTVYWYLASALPLLIGGAMHQALLFVGTRFRALRITYFRLVLSSPVVLSGFFIIGGSGAALYSMRALVPLLGLLLTYCAIVWRSMEAAAETSAR